MKVAPSESWPPLLPNSPLAVLVSGGLDSTILLAEAARAYHAVHPIYIRAGSVWEATEQTYLRRFLATIPHSSLRPLVTLQMPVEDLYRAHWSLSGKNVPDANTSDEAVFLPGRNVLLLSKSLLWCLLNEVPELATAPLGSNPFPDATDSFYDGFAKVVGDSVNGHVRVLRPYARMKLHKRDVLLRGLGLALEHTFSCIHPVGELHCGTCNKCAERQHGFADAGIVDPTTYANR